MFPQKLDWYDLEGTQMRAPQIHLRRCVRFKGLEPPGGAQTPTVSGLNAVEAQLRARCGQIVALPGRVFQELGGGLDAHGMRAQVLVVGVAAAVSEKTRQRVVAAGFERRAENVERLGWFVVGHGSACLPGIVVSAQGNRRVRRAVACWRG